MHVKLINFGSVAGEQVVKLACSLLVMTMCARYLGPSRFGAYTYVISIAVMFIPFAKLGVDGLAMLEAARSEERRDAIIRTGVLLQFVASIVASALAVGVSMSGDVPDGVSWTLAILACGILLASPGDTFYAALKGREKVLSISMFRTVSFVVISVLTLLALIAGRGVTEFVALRALEAIALSLCALLIFVRHAGHFRLAFDFPMARTLLKAAVPITIFGMATMIYTRIDQYMLGQMADEAILGQYSLAVRITELFSFVAIALQAAATASITRNFDDDSTDFGQFACRLFDVFSLFGWMCSAAILCTAPFVVVLIFGEAFAPSVPLVMILSLSIPLLFQRIALGTILTVQHRLWSAAAIAVAAAMLNVLLNLVLIPPLGGEGAAIATIVSLLAAGAVGSLCSSRERVLGMAMVRSLEPITTAWRIYRRHGNEALGAWRGMDHVR